MRVLAALSDNETGAAVLAVTQALASHIGADHEAVHVTNHSDVEVVRAMAAAARTSLTIVVSSEPVADALAACLASVDVALMVLGARDAVGDGRTAGHVALGVATQVGKPVVLVPPMPGDAARPLERVLVPLDGAPDTTEAMRKAMRLFGGSDVEVVGLHVFADGTVPRFWDKPDHEEAIWSREFTARNVVAPGARLELRLGSPAEAVIDLTGHERPGLVALAWSQELAHGRAPVVSEVLQRCRVPVLLVPVDPGRVGTFVSSDAPNRSRD